MSARFKRIGENANPVEFHLGNKIDQALEFLFRLARVAHDESSADSYAGHCFSQSGDSLADRIHTRRPAHTAQSSRLCVLQWDVEIVQNLVMPCHGLNKSGRDKTGISIHQSHPIHIKAIDTPEVLSVDREAIGDVLTANGMDAMPSWPDWTGRLAADFTWPLLRHDFHRSLQPDKPILDGEYHISGGVYPMPDRYVPAALWVLALHGRDLSACWVFDRVDDVSIYWHANGVEGLGRS